MQIGKEEEGIGEGIERERERIARERTRLKKMMESHKQEEAARAGFFHISKDVTGKLIQGYDLNIICMRELTVSQQSYYFVLLRINGYDPEKCP